MTKPRTGKEWVDRIVKNKVMEDICQTMKNIDELKNEFNAKYIVKVPKGMFGIDENTNETK